MHVGRDPQNGSAAILAWKSRKFPEVNRKQICQFGRPKLGEFPVWPGNPGSHRKQPEVLGSRRSEFVNGAVNLAAVEGVGLDVSLNGRDLREQVLEFFESRATIFR